MQRRRSQTQPLMLYLPEVIRSVVVSITREMKQNLMRTAYNAVIYEAEDFTVGLFDAEGNTISIGLGLPMFIRGLSDTIKAKIAHWGKENIEPGDILLTNLSEVMGSHLNHMIFTFPSSTMASSSPSPPRWPTGRTSAASLPPAASRATSTRKGLQMPFVKIFKRGVQDQELSAVIRANCRNPDRAMGDFRAQVWRHPHRRAPPVRAAPQVRQPRLQRERPYDLRPERAPRARASSGRSRTASMRRSRSWTTTASSIGKHIPIKVKVIVEGDEMTIDLSGVGAQVAGYFNSGSTAGRSGCQVAFKCITTPLLVPINDGAVRPLNIILPPGTVVSATARRRSAGG